MKLLRAVMKENRWTLAVFLAVSAMYFGVFMLYNIMTEAFFYTFVVCGGAILAALVIRYFCMRKEQADRRACRNVILEDWDHLPAPRTLAEADYQEMIRTLGSELERSRTEAERARADQLDYYTNWVHQIKTPIAVMKLKLSEDTAQNRALSGELFRVEQYVDMVLQYIRLGSSSNDLVIGPCDLDDLIRETIRKYASQFIEKKLHISYEKTDVKVVTDRKWLQCILDQLVGNAVKYTRSGDVKIEVATSHRQISMHRCEQPQVTLRISDTGIGIASEDLPRIFEKGYTGVNGRIGEKSSGLGLYLAKRSADLLAIPISAESTVGGGSTFALTLKTAE